MESNGIETITTDTNKCTTRSERERQTQLKLNRRECRATDPSKKMFLEMPSLLATTPLEVVPVDQLSCAGHQICVHVRMSMCACMYANACM